MDMLTSLNTSCLRHAGPLSLLHASALTIPVDVLVKKHDQGPQLATMTSMEAHTSEVIVGHC